ncbi:MAG: YcgN family cysteine cluster protein [Alphaproteobacteria bacterium]|nr:MAG: YcgN family cysteine cluster protein [Alphaproteobacteria bacterium]
MAAARRQNEAGRPGSDIMVDAVPFWRAKRLEEMNQTEWESLCDGCGRCCLVKLEEEETEDIYFTDVGCRLLDTGTCRCRDYRHRTERVDDCVRLTPETVAEIGWLPPTCGYRLVAEGKDLYWWHPLVSGDPETVHQAGISVRGRVEDLEDDVPADALEQRIVDWPLRIPKRARKGNPAQDAGRRTAENRTGTPAGARLPRKNR